MQTFTPGTINPEPYSPGAAIFDSARVYIGEPLDVLLTAAFDAKNPEAPCYLRLDYCGGQLTLELDSVEFLRTHIRSPWFVRKVGWGLDQLQAYAEGYRYPATPPGHLSICFGLRGSPPVSQLLMPA